MLNYIWLFFFVVAFIMAIVGTFTGDVVLRGGFHHGHCRHLHRRCGGVESVDEHHLRGCATCLRDLSGTDWRLDLLARTDEDW